MKILSIAMIDPATARQPTPEEVERMDTFVAELRSQGVLIDVGGTMDGLFEMKIINKKGKRTVIDGPFTEGKEVVGGYALFEVAGRDEAIELTTKFFDIVDNDVTCYLHQVSD